MLGFCVYSLIIGEGIYRNSFSAKRCHSQPAAQYSRLPSFRAWYSRTSLDANGALCSGVVRDTRLGKLGPDIVWYSSLKSAYAYADLRRGAGTETCELHGHCVGLSLCEEYSGGVLSSSMFSTPPVSRSLLPEPFACILERCHANCNRKCTESNLVPPVHRISLPLFLSLANLRAPCQLTLIPFRSSFNVLRHVFFGHRLHLLPSSGIQYMLYGQGFLSAVKDALCSFSYCCNNVLESLHPGLLITLSTAG